MRYDKYVDKMKKALATKKFISKHKIIIMIVSAVVLLLTLSYLFTSGIVTNVEVPTEFVYGQEIQVRGSALFKEVNYEYMHEGSDEWTLEQPTTPGVHKVRAVAKKIIGGTSYSDPVEFEIKPKEVVVNVVSSTLAFGDKPTLSADLEKGDHFVSAEFVYESFATSTTSASVIIESIVVHNSKGEDVTNAYKFTANPGEVSFDSRTLNVKITDATKVYDGTPLTSNEFTVGDGELLEGHRVEFVSKASITEVGTVTNDSKLISVFSGEVNVAENYKINVEAGSLTVTKRPIIVETSSKTRVYNGQALVNEEFTISNLGMTLVEGHKAVVVKNSSITNVGTCDNELKIAIYDANNIDVTSNYDITYDYGKLTVEKLAVSVETPSDYRIYNSLSLSNTNWIYSSNSNRFLEEHTVEIVNYASITEIGTIKNEIELKLVDGKNVDVTENYNITYTYGSLFVDSNEITIRTADDFKYYDGEPLECSDYEVSGLYSEYETVLVKSTSITDVAKVDNVITIKILKNGQDVTSNFKLNYQYGKLEVAPQEIYISLVDKTKEYDGKSLKSNEWVYSSDNTTQFLPNSKITIETSGEITYFGEVDNTVTSYRVVLNNKDITSNYKVTFDKAKLTITKRTVEIKIADQTKVYDGTPLISTNYTVTSSTSVVRGDVLTVFTEGSVTYVDDVNSSIMVDYKVVNQENKDVTSSYDIKYIAGILTIEPLKVSITIVDDSKQYDGNVLTSNKWIYTPNEAGRLLEDSSNLVLDMTGEITSYGDGINGVVVNDVQKYSFIINDKDYSPNYDIEFVPGTLTIIKKSVDIKILDASKDYDGTPLTTSSDYFDFINDTELLPGETLTIETTGSVTYVDDKNKINGMKSYKVVNALGEDVTASYDVNATSGTLTINKIEVSITIKDKFKTYDGTPLTSSEWVYTSGSEWIYEDVNYLSLIMNGTITTAGMVSNGVEAYTLIIDGKDYAPNYDITFVSGTLTVDKRVIHIQVSDATKVYDGSPLKSTKYEVMSDTKVISTDILTILTDGSMTNVLDTTVINTMVGYIVKNKDGKDVTSSYDVTADSGYLSVTAKPISISTITSSRVYNGQSFYGETVVFGNLITTDKYIELYDSKETITIDEYRKDMIDADTYTNMFTVKILKADGETDSTSNYNINYLYGYIIIDKKEITITTQAGKKEYDGLPFFTSDSSFEDLIDGKDKIVLEKSEEKLEINLHKVNLGIVDVNTYLNNVEVFVKKTNGDDSTDNYNITYVPGIIEITPKTIVIFTKDITTTYNSLPYYGDSISYGDIVITSENIQLKGSIERIKVVNYNTNMINAGEYENVVRVEIVKFDDSPSTFNYNIIYNTGTVTIKPIDIVISTKVDHKVYDGMPFYDEYASYEDVITTKNEIEFISNTNKETIKLVGYNTNMINVVEGGYENVVTVKIVKSDGVTDSTSNYNITYNTGTITIIKRTIEIKITDKTQVYNGKELKSTAWDYFLGNAVTDEQVLCQDRTKLILTTDGAITKVGSVDNNVTDYSLTIDGIEYKNNYNFIFYKGSLEITPYNLKIKIDDRKEYYTGQALTSDTYTISNGYSLANDDVLIIYTKGSITNYSEEEVYSVLDYYEIKDKDGNDIKNCYTLDVLPGLLTIEKLEISFSTKDDIVTYTGEAYYGENESIESFLEAGTKIALAKNETIKVINYNKNIVDANAIPYTNNLTIDIIGADGKTSSINNYVVNITYGEITVNKMAITITSVTNSKEYDGDKYYGETVEFNSLIIGNETILGTNEKIVIDTYEKNIVNVKDGGYKNYFTVNIQKGEGEEAKNTTDNYKINYIYGTITITPKTIELTHQSDERCYNALPYYTDDSLFKDFFVESNEIVLENTKEYIYIDYNSINRNMIDVFEYTNNETKVQIYKESNGESSTSNYIIK